MHTRIHVVSYPIWYLLSHQRNNLHTDSVQNTLGISTEFNQSHNKWSVVKILITTYCVLPPAFNPLRKNQTRRTFPCVFSEPQLKAVPNCCSNISLTAVCRVWSSRHYRHTRTEINRQGPLVFNKYVQQIGGVVSRITCVWTRQRWRTYY